MDLEWTSLYAVVGVMRTTSAFFMISLAVAPALGITPWAPVHVYFFLVLFGIGSVVATLLVIRELGQGDPRLPGD